MRSATASHLLAVESGLLGVLLLGGGGLLAGDLGGDRRALGPLLALDLVGAGLLGQLGLDPGLLEPVLLLLRRQVGLAFGLLGLGGQARGVLGGVGLALLQRTLFGEGLVADDAADCLLGLAGQLVEHTAAGVGGFFGHGFLTGWGVGEVLATRLHLAA